jgi:hypothetical protein
MGYILFDSAPALRSGRWLAAVFSFTAATLPEGGRGRGAYCGVVGGPKAGGRRNARPQFGKNGTKARGSAQERKLKIELKRGRRTLVAWKSALQMFHALQQRIRLDAGRGRLLTAKQCPQPVQTELEPASQGIHRLQRKGQAGFFAAALAESPASLWINHCHNSVAVKV